jgi:hypothetical protein
MHCGRVPAARISHGGGSCHIASYRVGTMAKVEVKE